MEVVNRDFEFSHNVPFNIKAVNTNSTDEDATITGYASTFGNIDRMKDIMIKGCFKKTIKETKGKWPVKLNHSIDIGANIKAKEDEVGLYVESKLYTSGVDALDDSRKALILVKNAIKYGHPMGLSISGIVKNYATVVDQETGKMFFEIREFEIVEHSLTSTPANPKAEITKLKSCIYKNNKDYLTKKEKNNKLLIDFLGNIVKNMK